MTQEAGKSKNDIAQKWADRFNNPDNRDHDVYDAILEGILEYAQQKEQPWVRVEDGLPEGESDVTAYIALNPEDFEDNDKYTIQRLRYQNLKWLAIPQHGFPQEITIGIVTHWMPLPAPPKD